MQRLEREPLLGEQSRPFYGLFRSQPSGSGDWPEVESSSTSSAAQSVVSGASDDRHPPPGTLIDTLTFCCCGDDRDMDGHSAR